MPVQPGPSLAGRLYDWTKAMVVLLYPDISNLTFENVKNVKGVILFQRRQDFRLF